MKHSGNRLSTANHRTGFCLWTGRRILSGGIMLKNHLCFFLILLLLSPLASSARQQAIDPQLAEQYFQEARAICARDAGQLWGLSLDAPMMLVDRQTRMIVASQADAEGRLVKQGNLYAGRLPDEENIANTATRWAGVKWTMMIYPLPLGKQERAQLMLHELFHHLQDELGFAAANPANAHLDSFAGRLWLQLEWRALQRALLVEGARRRQAIEDALIFRAHRRALFPQAAGDENALELNEGLAEYTGVRLRGSSPEESAVYFARQLQEFESRPTFVRSFAYASGPAYGLLLDKVNPQWRRSIRQRGDLAALLAKSLNIRLPANPRHEAERRSKADDCRSLLAAEAEREERRRKRMAEYQARFVEGAVLSLALSGQVQYSFNPNHLEVLDEANTIFPNVRISDVWGILTVTDGALLTRRDGQLVKVTITAPANPQTRPLQGDGWTLELKAGWQLAAGARHGDYTVKQ
jgi:hypothetical protein